MTAVELAQIKQRQKIAKLNNSEENTNMATQHPSKPAAPSTKPAPAPTAKPAPAPTAKPAPSAASAKSEGKRPRVRWQSTKDPSFWVRSFKDITDKHGAPMDPWGVTMVPAKRGASTGGDPGKKAAKAEREAKLAAMSAEQKAEFLKGEREAKKAKKLASKAQEVEAMKAKLLAELEEQYGVKLQKK